MSNSLNDLHARDGGATAIAETAAETRPWQLLALSAATGADLETLTGELLAHLRRHPDLPLADVAYSCRSGQPAFAHRRALVCRDSADAISALAARSPDRVLDGVYTGGGRPVAMMFSGLGDHYVDLALGLYQAEPAFRATVDHCAAQLAPHLGLDLRDVLYPERGRAATAADTRPPQGLDLRRMLRRGGADDAAAQRLQQTLLAQPALFVIEYALARLLMEWGIRPMAMIGYSLGEYVAACLANVLSLDDALLLVAGRARLIHELPAGAMLAVSLDETQLRPYLDEQLSLAAVNGPALSVVAGPPAAVTALEQQLGANGVVCRRLSTTHAFHSRMMEPVAEALVDLARQVTLRPPAIPYISNVTGTWITAAEATDPRYWARHLGQTVRFADGLAELWQLAGCILLEVGPGQALSSLALLHPGRARAASPLALPTLRHAYDQQPDTAFLLRALGRLWVAGGVVDWDGLYGREQRRRLDLPALPGQPGSPTLLPEEKEPHLPAGHVREANATSSADSLHPPPPAGEEGQRGEGFSAIEQQIADLWQEILHLDRVERHANFFEVGGNSLLATRLIFRLRKTFRVSTSLRSIFAAPTVATLARLVDDLRGGASAPATPAPPPPARRRHSYTLPNGMAIVHQSEAEALQFYQDIFVDEAYVKNGIQLRDGDCVFDVGANIGLFTLFVHHRYPGCRIYAFEPSPPTFELLRGNVELHQASARLFNIGLANEEKTATFTHYPLNSGMSSFYADSQEEKDVLRVILRNQLQMGVAGMAELMEYSEELLDERFRGETYNCRLRTLSAIIAEQQVERIDLLKIDVQKSELDVLMGIADGDWDKIRQIVIEVHDLDGQLDRVTSLLSDRGYNIVLEQEALYQGSVMYNIYAIRRPQDKVSDNGAACGSSAHLHPM